LATTEKNKLIPTILSRCQIFDFKKISDEDISDYLKLIANHKEINVCNKTLEIISNKADGSLRDALSIFDKISSHFEENWNYNDALRLMSTLDSSFSIELARFILDNDISNCILQIDRVISEGYNPKEILKNTISHFRNLILAKDASTFGLINERTDFKNIIKEQSEAISKRKIIDSLVCLDKCSQQLRNSINKRFDVELCVLKLCAMNSDQKKKII
jgi:DNA polymerase-3 subunit gamma/tau